MPIPSHSRRAPTVGELFANPAHAGGLGEATRRGLALDDDRRAVELALWTDAAGRVARARWKATSCVSLMACAERACQLLEAGVAPRALDGARLSTAVGGLHPDHHRHAALVIRALHAALANRSQEVNP